MFFSNLFKPRQLNETEIENEYLLLHDILITLYNAGFSTSRIGSEASGYKPIYEYGLSTGYIEFATLGAVLNQADIVNPVDKDFLYLKRLDVKEENVIIKRCSWIQLSKAVDTLEVAKEVEKAKASSGASDVYVKTVHLTEVGLYSLHTRKYQTLYQLERDKRILQNSTISTNFWMRWFTGIAALATAATFAIQLYDIAHKSPTIIQLKEAIYAKPTLPNPTYNSPHTKKKIVDSIPFKK